jgi:putative membrane protein
MRLAALALIALIALLHFYIAWFEIFAWTTIGARVLDMFPPDLFAQTTQLAANQGIYNAFLAVGLVWALLIKDPSWQKNVANCFLGFVLVAGVFASITVAFKSGLPQMVPSAIALVLLNLSKSSKDA